MTQSHTLITAGGVSHTETVRDEIPTLSSQSGVDKPRTQDAAHVRGAYSEMSPTGTASGADALSCTQLPASGVSPAGGGFYSQKGVTQ